MGGYTLDQARELAAISFGIGRQVGLLIDRKGRAAMYHINAGVPKTLIRYLAEWSADEVLGPEAAATVRDICATPITPELLPLGADGSLVQCTEQVIGPYELHDFFLFMVFLSSRTLPGQE